MAKAFDIIERLKQKNEKPLLKITEELTVSIDNSKTTVLAVEALMRSNKEEEFSFENVTEMLSMLVGKKQVKEIDKLGLSIIAYNDLVQAVVSIATKGEIDFENL